MLKHKFGGEVVELEVDLKRTHEKEMKLEVELNGAIDNATYSLILKNC